MSRICAFLSNFERISNGESNESLPTIDDHNMIVSKKVCWTQIVQSKDLEPRDSGLQLLLSTKLDDINLKLPNLNLEVERSPSETHFWQQLEVRKKFENNFQSETDTLFISTQTANE